MDANSTAAVRLGAEIVRVSQIYHDGSYVQGIFKAEMYISTLTYVLIVVSIK